MNDLERESLLHVNDSDEEERAYALLEQEMYANNMINKLTLSSDDFLKEEKIVDSIKAKENMPQDNLILTSQNQLEQSDLLEKIFLDPSKTMAKIDQKPDLDNSAAVSKDAKETKGISEPVISAKTEQDGEMAEQDLNDMFLMNNYNKKRLENETVSSIKLSDKKSKNNVNQTRNCLPEKKSTVSTLVDTLSSRFDLPSTRLEFLCQHFLRLVKNVEDLMKFIDGTSEYSFGDKEEQFDFFFNDYLIPTENRNKEICSRLRRTVTERKEQYRKKIIKYRHEITSLGKRVNESAWSGAKKNVMRSVLQRYKELPNQDKATVKTTAQAITNIDNWMEDLHSISKDVDPIVSYIDTIPKLAQVCNKMGCMVGDEDTINILLNDAISKLAYLPIKEVCYNLQCTEEDMKQKKKQFATKNRNDKQKLADLLPPPVPVSIPSVVPATPNKKNVNESIPSSFHDTNSKKVMKTKQKEPETDFLEKNHEAESSQHDSQETGSVISDVTLKSSSTINTCQTDYVPGTKSNKIKNKKTSKRQPNFTAATAASKAGSTTKVAAVPSHTTAKKSTLVVKSTNSSNLRKSKGSLTTTSVNDTASVYSSTSKSIKTTRSRLSTANDSLRGGKGQGQKNNTNLRASSTGLVREQTKTSSANNLRRSNFTSSTGGSLRKKSSDQLETSSIVSVRSLYSTKSEIPSRTGLKSTTGNRRKTSTNTSSNRQSAALRR